jgi:hypothetical protein
VQGASQFIKEDLGQCIFKDRAFIRKGEPFEVIYPMKGVDG